MKSIDVSDAARQAIQKEFMTLKLMRIRKELPTMFTFQKDKQNSRKWDFSIPGAKGSPWEGYKLTGKILFPGGYPKGSISLFFQPTIYHPNVDPFDGLVCDTGMKCEGIAKVIHLPMNLHELLRMPNPDDCYNKEAAKMANEDYRQYLRIAKEDASKKLKRI